MPELILDRTSIDGLLRMAGDEGLLCDREDRGDRYLYSLQKRPFPEWHRQQILEQVILSSRIHTIHNIPFDWLEGEFLETNPIQVSESTNEAEEELKAISPEAIEGILRARGYDREFGEWLTIFERSNAVLEEAHKFEKHNPGTKITGVSAFVKGAIKKEFRQSEEYQLAQKWNEAYIEVSPLMSAFKEFLALSQFASSTTHYLKTPVYSLSPNLFNFSTDESTESDVVRVYRITTRELGFLPICQSLHQAMELANSLEAISLRNQIDEWMESLSRNSADLTISIQAEIKKASSSLAKAKAVKTTGNLAGYISIPASAAGLFIPLLGAIGFGLTCVAILFNRSGKRIEERVRWVGFGSKG